MYTCLCTHTRVHAYTVHLGSIIHMPSYFGPKPKIKKKAQNSLFWAFQNPYFGLFWAFFKKTSKYVNIHHNV